MFSVTPGSVSFAPFCLALVCSMRSFLSFVSEVVPHETSAYFSTKHIVVWGMNGDVHAERAESTWALLRYLAQVYFSRKGTIEWPVYR